MVARPPPRILAIDPGTTESAWVFWDGEHVLMHGKEPNGLVLARCRTASLAPPGNTVYWSNNWPTLVIEKIESFGMAVGAEVFETVYWSGRFAEAYHAATGREAARIGRRVVKLAICGNPQAKDANIRQALIDKIGPRGTKKAPGPTYGLAGDEWSALAVAVTYAEKHNGEAVALVRAALDKGSA